MIGEIGGQAEEEAAEFAKDHITKPILSFIAGKTAPSDKRMGHAGAIVSGGQGTAESKIQFLKKNGIFVVDNPDEIGNAMLKLFKS